MGIDKFLNKSLTRLTLAAWRERLAAVGAVVLFAYGVDLSGRKMLALIAATLMLAYLRRSLFKPAPKFQDAAKYIDAFYRLKNRTLSYLSTKGEEARFISGQLEKLLSGARVPPAPPVAKRASLSFLLSAVFAALCYFLFPETYLPSVMARSLKEQIATLRQDQELPKNIQIRLEKFAADIDAGLTTAEAAESISDISEAIETERTKLSDAAQREPAPQSTPETTKPPKTNPLETKKTPTPTPTPRSKDELEKSEKNKDKEKNQTQEKKDGQKSGDKQEQNANEQNKDQQASEKQKNEQQQSEQSKTEEEQKNQSNKEQNSADNQSSKSDSDQNQQGQKKEESSDNGGKQDNQESAGEQGKPKQGDSQGQGNGQKQQSSNEGSGDGQSESSAGGEGKQGDKDEQNQGDSENQSSAQQPGSKGSESSDKSSTEGQKSQNTGGKDQSAGDSKDTKSEALNKAQEALGKMKSELAKQPDSAGQKQGQAGDKKGKEPSGKEEGKNTGESKGQSKESSPKAGAKPGESNSEEKKDGQDQSNDSKVAQKTSGGKGGNAKRFSEDGTAEGYGGERGFSDQMIGDTNEKLDERFAKSTGEQTPAKNAGTSKLTIPEAALAELKAREGEKKIKIPLEYKEQLK